MLLRLVATPAFAIVLALTGCAGLRVQDQTTDVPTRMMTIATRFDQDFHTGGMAKVESDIDGCYQQTTLLVTQVYALQDCLALDYTGYTTDVHLGRQILKEPPLPYFADSTFAARAAHYGLLDGFPGPQQLANFLRDTQIVIQADLVQLNAGPMIVHHPVAQPLASHP